MSEEKKELEIHGEKQYNDYQRGVKDCLKSQKNVFSIILKSLERRTQQEQIIIGNVLTDTDIELSKNMKHLLDKEGDVRE